MTAELSGVRVVVTGATGGIGQALVRALVEGGAQVAVTGRSKPRLDTLTGQYPTVFAQAADIAHEGEVAAFMDAAAERLGGMDVLINLAGLSTPGEIATFPVEDFVEMLNVNVVGTFLSCKHAMAHLPDGRGLIINVGSVAGTRPNPTAPGYCTAKAALAMFSDSLALQLKERQIRVTLLAPGGTDTPFWGDRPVKREALLSPEDVVSALLYVVSLPAHVVVRALTFESTGLARPS